MNPMQIEAYDYYKESDAPFIIFFRIGNNYVVLKDDAKKVSEALNVPLEDGCVTFPVDGILDVLGELSGRGLIAKTVTYRDDAGRYTIPDVTRLKAEKELDQ